jgi:hypothetical protein
MSRNGKAQSCLRTPKHTPKRVRLFRRGLRFQRDRAFLIVLAEQ